MTGGSDEWLLTDGRGGFAMGTRRGAPSRRYHALHVAALDPPIRRTVILRMVVEAWCPEDGSGAPDWQQSVLLHPTHFGEDATLQPSPETELQAGLMHRRIMDPRHRVLADRWTRRGDAIVRSLWLDEDGGAHLDWMLRSATGGWFAVRPFLPLTDFHALTRAADAPPTVTERAESSGVHWWTVRRGDVAASITITAPHAASLQAESSPEWWHDVARPDERDRGLDWIGDEWSPGRFILRVEPGAAAAMRLTSVASIVANGGTAPTRELEAIRVSSVAAAWRHGATRDPSPYGREDLRPDDDFGAGPGGPDGSATTTTTADEALRETDAAIESILDSAAEQFLVQRGLGRTVIAGYPWFADWGRDTMIALPGLLPPGERDDEALEILATFGRLVRGGLLPNCFHDAERDALDNTADAGPWFLRTVGRYVAAGEAEDMAMRAAALGIWDACAAIVDGMVAGARHGIRVDDDGLITSGEPGGAAVTWMDAVRDGVVFTPRIGKAVEINGLWIEGLRGLARYAPDRALAERAHDLADRASQGFLAFIRSDGTGLHDRLERDPDGGGWRGVPEIRPNQLIAAACPAVPLDARQRDRIVRVTAEHLLTPCGLRTLSPDDPAYRGRYEGDLAARDAAYHQGTVWPWLLGPFWEASRLAGADEASRTTVDQTIRRHVAAYLDRIAFLELGLVPEVHDGDAPYRPSGCPQQAWSVSEIRRIWRGTVAAMRGEGARTGV